MINYIKRVIKRIKEGWLEEFYSEVIWISKYSFRYKWQIIWYIFLGIFSTIMGFGGGIISKHIIDAVTGFDSNALLPAAIAYILMSVFRIGSNAWIGRVSAKIEIKVNQEMKADVFDKLMLADWESMLHFHSGDLLNRMDNDVSLVAASVIGWIPNLIIGLAQFFGALGIILYYDVTLAMLALISAPLTLIVSKVLIQKMRLYNKKMREVSSDLMAFNEEAFQNIQYIKAFGLTEQYGKKLRDVQENYKEIQLDYNKFSLTTSSFMSFTGMIVSSACFGWGAYRLWAGAITYGTMTLFLQMANTLSGAFTSIINMVPQAISAATAAGRIMAVTELPIEDRSQVFAVQDFIKKYQKEGIILQMNHFDFEYQNGKKVLEDASFYACPQEVIAIVGPSGEGKTTILRILLGLMKGKSGNLQAFDYKKQDSIFITPSSRNLFSYVPQGNTMLSGTIIDNLRLVKEDASNEEVWQVLSAVCAEGFVKNLPDGIYTKLGERGSGLSEGQIQRLSIARALLCDAPILLLDEATSALDVSTERKILRNLMDSKWKKTCIVTTHRPSVLTMCDRVYRILNCSLTCLDEKDIEKLLVEF